MKVLLRLLPYITEHIWAFVFGMAGLLGARVFEAMIPLYVKQGIDSITGGKARIATGAIDFHAALATLAYPALAITACVVAQILVTIISRALIRRIGMYAAFDLRNRIYRHLQLQGPIFFSRYSIGDLMARAINDISLVRQVVAAGLRFAMAAPSELFKNANKSPLTRPSVP